MQITIDAKELTSALAVLRKAAGVLHAPLSCKHILVTADAGELRLEAYAHAESTPPEAAG